MALLAGNVAQFTVTFTTESTGQPIDPTTIVFSYSVNGGATLNSWTYTSATTPAVGTVARISTGVYEVWVDTTGLNGNLVGNWLSTGTGAARTQDSIQVGTTQTSTQTSTLATMIAQTLRRIQPGQQIESLTLSSSYTAGATSLSVTDLAGTILPSLRPETVISIDLELFYVQAVSGTTVTVVPGYLGSTEANHSSGAMVYLNPRFSAFDIMCAINDDLNDLCAPENGLYAVNSVEISYNPSTIGYDLTGVSGLIDIISVQQRMPYPIGYWVPIPRRHWTLTNNADTTDFPSGYALRYNSPKGFPGMPFRVTYKSIFSPFVNLTDDATNVAGLSPTMYDLPPLGAMVALVAPREVKRNQIDSEPDSRRGTEVPPGAVMNSVAQVLALRQRRINAEATRLKQLYGNQAGR
jgi:hypothetical protein